MHAGVRGAKHIKAMNTPINLKSHRGKKLLSPTSREEDSSTLASAEKPVARKHKGRDRASQAADLAGQHRKEKKKEQCVDHVCMKLPFIVVYCRAKRIRNAADAKRTSSTPWDGEPAEFAT